MSRDGDLEIVLRWDRKNAAFEIGVRFDVPADNVEEWMPPVDPIPIDLDELARLRADESAYGQALTRMVLGVESVQPFVLRALHHTEGRNRLHVRLHIAAPPRFHAIRWELLQDPRTGQTLAAQADILLSRYLSSSDWRSIPALAEHDLRALIVVAGPEFAAEETFGGRTLAPVAVADELARAREALKRIPHVRALSDGQATLDDLLAELEQGVDILYLVCHGVLVDEVPVLLLEKSDRSPDLVDGRKLEERLAELDRRPTIAMLSSCQSAAGDAQMWSQDDGALSALGPRLAKVGVAAVVAMQGNVSIDTATVFAPAFFTALADHNGRVDEAMAAGRRAIRSRPDWWVPVLFSRLRSGRTYYRPAFTEREEATWQSLKLSLSQNAITPVLGPGLAGGIIGSRQQIARNWVERWQMPISPRDQGDLAKVAQYLRVHSGAPSDVWLRVQQHLLDEMVERRTAHRGDPIWDLPDDKLKGPSPVPAILEVGRRLRRADEGDPYRVMAGLQVPIYITTNWTDLLQKALEDEGRKPVTMMFPWNKHIPTLRPRLEPTAATPLVYHLYGRLDNPASLVLSEDDYFRWITEWISARKYVPTSVKSALTTVSLLFLGYSLDDWDFRVLFHGIKSFAGSRRLEDRNHVGVQLSPQSQTIDTEAAQEYLESYFGDDKITIYWGETRTFLDELRTRKLLP
ncbi:CHAT domain-containing protein [Actinoplanes aureus]|uniref:CHAT domain-containing protein n=1 Tax=Actinoplanes aureus TaxID=2792083 RepID=A0A931G0F0_9ACTN|nr:CHAT domain-containing protein [Actinoplanes aureus]MBG0566713.1 CHAT domain-containing protein [Actinoplanes aureus]